MYKKLENRAEMSCDQQALMNLMKINHAYLSFIANAIVRYDRLF